MQFWLLYPLHCKHFAFFFNHSAFSNNITKVSFTVPPNSTPFISNTAFKYQFTYSIPVGPFLIHLRREGNVGFNSSAKGINVPDSQKTHNYRMLHEWLSSHKTVCLSFTEFILIIIPELLIRFSKQYPSFPIRQSASCT